MTRNPFPKRSFRETNILDLIHTDVCGPMRVESIGRAKYFVEFIDDKSRWCEVRFLRSKADVFKVTKEFIAFVESQKSRNVKCLQSDNGKEYTSQEFTIYLKKRGIIRRLTIPYNPEQNGVAERRNRTLIDTARCLMIGSGLPASFWAKAVNTANYIRNRLPSKSLNGQTPYEMWTGRAPDVGNFKVFGSPVFYLDREPGRGKFDPRGKRGIFLGYADTNKGYRIWSNDGKKVIISRDVRFIEGNKSHDDYYDFTPIEQSDKGDITGESLDSQGYADIQLNPTLGSGSGSVQHDAYIEDTGASEDGIGIPAISGRGRGRPTFIRTVSRGRPRKVYQPAIENSAIADEEYTFLSEILIWPRRQRLV